MGGHEISYSITNCSLLTISCLLSKTKLSSDQSFEKRKGEMQAFGGQMIAAWKALLGKSGGHLFTSSTLFS